MTETPYLRRDILKAGTSGLVLSGVLSQTTKADVSAERSPRTTESHSQVEQVITTGTQIKDWHDLAAVHESLSDDYVLVNDLDETTSGYEEHVSHPETGWEPIGDGDTPFQGTFDGGANRIIGLNVNYPNEDYVGLFGCFDGYVTQLGIKDGSARGDDQTALLAGENRGEITQSFTHGTVTGTNNVGGLVGRNAGGRLESTYTVATVSGKHILGGLLGSNERGSVVASYAAGELNQIE